MRAGDRRRLGAELLVGGWAFAESLSWPLLPDMAVGALAAWGPPSRAVRLAAWATLGSAGGALVHHRLVARGLAPPQPLTTPRMVDAVDRWLGGHRFSGFVHQPLSGVPHKVFAARASRHGFTGAQVAAATVLFRGPRLIATASAAWAARVALQRALVSRRTDAGEVSSRIVACASVGAFSAALAGMRRRWR